MLKKKVKGESRFLCFLWLNQSTGPSFIDMWKMEVDWQGETNDISALDILMVRCLLYNPMEESLSC